MAVLTNRNWIGIFTQQIAMVGGYYYPSIDGVEKPLHFLVHVFEIPTIAPPNFLLRDQFLPKRLPNISCSVIPRYLPLIGTLERRKMEVGSRTNGQ